MTKGEYRVGITFNPSNDDMVGKIKSAAADLIDLIETIPLPKEEGPLGEYKRQQSHSAEVGRLKALAQTHVEDAAMWAVKAATKPAAQ
jgi:hypothetical protein